MVALLLLLLAASPVDKQVVDIRKAVTAIDADKSLVEAEVERMGESAEGGSAKVFRQGKTIRKIVSTLHGEMGQGEERIYFAADGRTPIFLFVTSSGYDKPFGKVVESVEGRYWFVKGKVIRFQRNETPTEEPEALEGAQDEADQMTARALAAAEGKSLLP